MKNKLVLLFEMEINMGMQEMRQARLNKLSKIKSDIAGKKIVLLDIIGSSNIDQIGYDEETETLLVVFSQKEKDTKNGRYYDTHYYFRPVSKSDFEELKGAPSKVFMDKIHGKGKKIASSTSEMSLETL